MISSIECHGVNRLYIEKPMKLTTRVISAMTIFPFMLKPKENLTNTAKNIKKNRNPTIYVYKAPPLS